MRVFYYLASFVLIARKKHYYHVNYEYQVDTCIECYEPRSFREFRAEREVNWYDKAILDGENQYEHIPPVFSFIFIADNVFFGYDRLAYNPLKKHPTL